MLFRHRKAQNWDYVAHLRGVAVVMNVLRAKEVVVVNQAQCSQSSRSVAGSELAGAPRGLAVSGCV